MRVSASVFGLAFREAEKRAQPLKRSELTAKKAMLRSATEARALVRRFVIPRQERR
jgi:hypothetical protein